jgi:hypothetical protein
MSAVPPDAMALPLALVQANAHALGLELNAAEAERVALHLGRTLALADLLQAFPLEDHEEVAAIYAPGPQP